MRKYSVRTIGIAAAIAALSLAAPVGAASASPNNGTNPEAPYCHAYVEKNSALGIDKYAVSMYCYEIPAGVEVRAGLDLPLADDVHTVWTSTAGKIMYSGWVGDWPGPRGTYIEVRPKQ